MKIEYRENRTLSILVSILCYTLALWAAIETAGYYDLRHPLTVIAVADLVATVIIFLMSVLFNNSSIYDPYWSVKPAIIAGYYVYLAAPDGLSARQVVVTILIALYAIRLTSNFYRDWPGLKHEDWRYRNFRQQFPRAYWIVSFFGIHFFPTLMVYLACLPMYGIYSQAGNPFGALDILASALLLGSVVLAFVADEQLRQFRKDPANTGQFIDTGLWKFSRHPNYLGEICTWWGLWLFALAAGQAWWWTGAGALAISLMFIFVSIPMMEKRTLERREGYLEYMRVTPMLIPLGTRQK